MRRDFSVKLAQLAQAHNLGTLTLECIAYIPEEQPAQALSRLLQAFVHSDATRGDNAVYLFAYERGMLLYDNTQDHWEYFSHVELDTLQYRRQDDIAYINPARRKRYHAHSYEFCTFTLQDGRRWSLLGDETLSVLRQHMEHFLVELQLPPLLSMYNAGATILFENFKLNKRSISNGVTTLALAGLTHFAINYTEVGLPVLEVVGPVPGPRFAIPLHKLPNLCVLEALVSEIQHQQVAWVEQRERQHALRHKVKKNRPKRFWPIAATDSQRRNDRES